MKTAQYFSYFCSVQHRLCVSPQAAALFFFILGELSAAGFSSDSIAMANSRICGTVHISTAALRKCREELIAAGIITFSSTDNGKSLSLYTLCETGRWQLDVVPVPSPKPVLEVAVSSPGPAAEVAAESRKNEVTDVPETSRADRTDRTDQTDHHNTAAPPALPQENRSGVRRSVKTPVQRASQKPSASRRRCEAANRVADQKLRTAAAALRRYSSRPIKLIYNPRF